MNDHELFHDNLLAIHDIETLCGLLDTLSLQVVALTVSGTSVNVRHVDVSHVAESVVDSHAGSCFNTCEVGAEGLDILRRS